MGHFLTITKHRHAVMKNCFRAGIPWRGLVHDLSKYSPTEFFNGVRYFQGDRSPNEGEREAKGYSEAWMHHKGRNRHHYEYWTDYSLVTKRVEPVKMPTRDQPMEDTMGFTAARTQYLYRMALAFMPLAFPVIT